MKRLIPAFLVLLGFLGASFAARAAPVVFMLPTIAGASSTLTGSITVDDINSNGFVTQSEIVGFQFQSAGSVNFSFNSTEPGAAIECTGSSGCFSILGTQLAFDFSSLVELDPYASFGQQDCVFGVSTVTCTTSRVDFLDEGFSLLGSINGVAWSHSVNCSRTNNGPGFCGASDFFNARDVADAETLGQLNGKPRIDAVPEPGSLALLALGLVGLGYSRRKS